MHYFRAMEVPKKLENRALNTTVIIAGLGYFVDIYDLQLFNIIGKESIMSPKGLNITDTVQAAHLFDNNLFYWQMAGMLLGGLIWGILGDLKGRKSILFGSILLYSVANIANAFVTSVEQYQIIRFLAGVGLAGELGAAITLVSEIMTKENRGYGTMIIVTLGALGAVFAAMVKKFAGSLGIFGFENWQIAYLIGGGMGLLLLLLRFGTFESGMFERSLQSNSSKGNFMLLLRNRKTLLTYIYCIMVGLPVWYVIGTLVKLSGRFADQIGINDGKVDFAFCIMYCYIGLSAGDLLCGWLSQIFRTRKRVVLGYLIANIVIISIYFFIKDISVNAFYFLTFLLGCCTGYWALFVTIASEQFGTNIRATATTTVPNFVRGAVIPIGMSFFYLLDNRSYSINASAIIVGVICFGLAIFSITQLEETFGKNLDYEEV